MNEQLVANGFRQITGVNLRALYVVVKKLHAGHLVASKVNDMLSTEQSLYKKIKKEIDAYTAVADAQVQLGLLLEMAQKLKLPKVALTDENVLLLQVQAMIEQLYNKYTEHEKASLYIERALTPLDAILALHLKQLERLYIKEMKKLTTAQKALAYEQLALWMTDDVVTLNDAAFMQVVTQHARDDYAKQIEVAAKLIASLPTMKLDDSLDPVLAIFMHPNFLKFDMFGISTFSMTKQLDNTRMLFLGIALTTLAVEGARHDKADLHILVAHWQHMVNQRAKLKVDIDALHHHIGQHEALLVEFGTRLDEAQRQVDEAAYYVKQAKERLYEDFNVTRADMEITDTTYHAYYKRFKDAEREVEVLRGKNEQHLPKSSLLSKLMSKVKTTANNVSIKTKEREKKKLYEAMIDLFITLDSRYLANEKADIRTLQQRVEMMEQAKAVIEQERVPIVNAMRELQQKINEKEQAIAHMERLFYSIEVGTPSAPTAPRQLPPVETKQLDLEDVVVEEQ